MDVFSESSFKFLFVVEDICPECLLCNIRIIYISKYMFLSVSRDLFVSSGKVNFSLDIHKIFTVSFMLVVALIL